MPKEIKENWENREISEKAKQTAKHIGIISEGAIQTLIDEVRASREKEILEEIEKELHDFRANCKRLEEIKSPILILDTSKNFFIQKIKPLLIKGRPKK